MECRETPRAGEAGLEADEVELSVVMPCLDEARTVGTCVAKAIHGLQAANVAGEVIVADNGSTDTSAEIARAQGARVVSVAEQGYGSALRGGIASARGRFVIVGDADASYDFEVLVPFLEALRRGDDLVVGNRFRGGIRPGAMPWLHRYVGNPALTGLLNLFFRSPIGDAHCGLRGFRKASFDRLGLCCPGMEFASEMVVKAQLDGQRLSEVPIVLYPDGRDRRPHLRSFRDGWRHLKFLLRLAPGWLYLPPACLLLAFGLWAIILASPSAVGGARSAMATGLAGLASLLVGGQIFWYWAASATRRALGPSRRLAAFGRPIRLEEGLVLGLMLILSALGLALAAFGPWADPLPGSAGWAFRLALWAAAMAGLGVQVAFASFFLDLLGSAPSGSTTDQPQLNLDRSPVPHPEGRGTDAIGQ